MSAPDNTDRRWRTWSPSIDGYRGLARYVAPDALADIQFDDVDTRPVVPGQPLAERNRETVERLYHRLARKDTAYSDERWNPAEDGQSIRYPRQLLEDRQGNCMDFAATYAGMCLRDLVPPLLVTTQNADGGGHVFVVTTPGRDPRELPELGASDLEERDDDVHDVTDGEALRARLASGAWIGVEFSGRRGRQASSFEEARQLCLEHVDRVIAANGTVCVVDVARIQRSKLYPYVAPSTPARIRTYLPGGRARFDAYRSHAGIVEAIRHQSGVVVLLGDSGTGKSTIARQLAAEAGTAWFLTAPEPQALINSLCQAGSAGRSNAAQAPELPEREGEAYRALGTLSASDQPWLVVLDNADGDPGKLLPLLPRPNPDKPADVRQLVLVTTTNPAWERLYELPLQRLPPVEDEEAPDHLPGPELVELAQGRPLLFDAFARLAAATGWDGAKIASYAPAADSLPPELLGPATVWAAVRDVDSLGPDAASIGAHAAYLPPDHQPRDVLRGLAPNGDVDAAIARLAELGQLSFDAEAGVARLHRLFGAAIRAELERDDDAAADAAVLTIANDAGTQRLLDAHGDLDTLTTLERRAEQLDARSASASRELGTTLSEVASLLELHGHTTRSADLYAHAERHLLDDPVLLAQSLHGRARTVNQHYLTYPKDEREARLREALAWAQRAQALLAGSAHPGNADRSRAMEGLLLQKLASYPRAGETELELLHEARAVIEEADERRRARLRDSDPDNPELARSHFNLAGIRVRLARAEPQRASEHLQAAWHVYEAVEKKRREIYGRDHHPHVAACIIGLAYVAYFRALLVPATQAQRTRWLREATDRALEALRMREALEGSLDGVEAIKCTRFLAKVALARDAIGAAQRTRSREAFDDDLGGRTQEALAEIADARLVLASTPPLPSTARDADAAIDAWARSPALAETIAALAPDAEPPYREDLATLLAWLDDFSVRWDFRGGNERNLVVDRQLGEAADALVPGAAHALGLVGTTPPPSSRYDHVLILGGLVRACLARPLHAARLLRERTIEASAVTALGGYRELRGDELELAARFGMSDLTDELDAMHAGMRAAFELGEPVDDRGEPSDVVGAAWRVVEYAGPHEIPLRVVAAPSREPGGRRANTPDTYEWFASTLAKLRRGQRILIVTTDIYAPYQHADALRMLALPHAVEIDVVGIRPGDVDPRLAQEFKPHNYLQEIRSTIRAYRQLHEAARAGG